jgi:hypothetical protein
MRFFKLILMSGDITFLAWFYNKRGNLGLLDICEASLIYNNECKFLRIKKILSRTGICL